MKTRTFVLPLAALAAGCGGSRPREAAPAAAGEEVAQNPQRDARLRELLDESSKAIPAARPPVATRPAPKLDRKHPFSVHDMVRLERLGTPVPSPDGRLLLHTRQAWDPDANQKTTSLWLLASDGSAARPLTTLKGVGDGGAIWSPDSKTVLFTSSRDGGGKAWRIRVDGGEATKLLDLAVDVENLRLSPDGSTLAFSAEVYPGATIAETAKRDAAQAKNPVKAKSYEKLMVRHWDTWEDGKRSHLFVVKLAWDADGTPSVAGEPLDLMKDLDADCPTKPFGGIDDFVFSPDGQEIAYVAQPGADMAWSTNLDLFTVPVAGGASKNLTAGNLATDKAPAYSPDGSQLLWLAMARPGFEADRLAIRVMDRASGAVRSIADGWDRSPGAVAWTPDGKALIATAEEQARTRIFSIDAASGAVTTLVADHWNDGVAIVPAHDGAPACLAYSQDSFMAPPDLWRCELDGSKPLRLTQANDARLALVERSQPEELSFAGFNGEMVQGWLAKPVGFEAGKKYPVAFVIHGGPQGTIGDHFHFRWNLNAFAGAGYATIAINFHGSTGFGQAFTDSISGDWGGKPFFDLMAGLDAALAQFEWLDGDRVVALGASYGGWMINWINGNTRRFKALVCHDGGFDETSSYFTTDELWFNEWEMKGTPWEKPDGYKKWSPSRHVEKWSTPELVIHGAQDFRLTDNEGLAAFTALQRRGIPSKFLWFPEENHWVLRPLNSIHWHDSVLEWMDRWTAPEPPKAK